MNIILLKQSDIDVFWSYIDRLLTDALIKSRWIERYPIDSLLDDLENGVLQCWIVSDEKDIHGVAITQELEYPLGKSLMVFLLSGNRMIEWYKDLNIKLAKYAKKNKIKWIDACAREGLGKKYLSNIGYKNHANHYVLGVNNG